MSHRLQVLISEELATQLRKAAQRSRLSRGEWVRRAIQKALGEERVASDPLEALSGLEGPTGDIHEILADIEAGRR